MKHCTILSVYFSIMNVILTSMFRRVVRNNFSNIIIVTILVRLFVPIIEKLFPTTLRNIEVIITFNSKKYTGKMATYHEAIPLLIFEIFYTKLGWSSRLSDIREKPQEICQSTRLFHYLWECQRRNDRATKEASCEVVNRNSAPETPSLQVRQRLVYINIADS